MPKSAEDVYTHISPGLHPDNVKSVAGYDQHQSYLNGVLESLSVAYVGLAQTHKARLAADKNVTMNKAGRLLVTGRFAEKQQGVITRKIDKTMAALNTSITGMEDMLNTPLKAAAGATGSIPNEIRMHVKALTPDERYKFLNDVQKAGDTTTLSAVLGAPIFLSGITEAERVARTRQYHEHNAPEVSARLVSLKAGRDLLSKRSALVFGEFEKAMGSSWNDLHNLRDAQSKSNSVQIIEGVE